MVRLLSRVGFSKAGIGIFCISALNQLITLGILMMLTRVMMPAQFGLLSVVMAALTIAALPFRGGLPLYTMQHMASASPETAAGLLRRWRWLVPLLAACVGVVLTCFFYIPPMIVAPFYLAAMASVMFSGAVQRGFLYIVRSRVTELLLQPSLLIVLVSLCFAFNNTLSAVGAMMLQTVTFIVAAVCALFLMRYAIPVNILQATPVYDDRRWFAGALPMLFGMGLITLNAAVDVVMVGYILSEADAGPYRLAAQLATFLTFFLAVSNNATQASVSKLYAENKRDALQQVLTRAVRWTFVLSAVPALILVIWPASVMTLFFGAAYEVAAASLQLLALVALFNIGTGQAAQLLLLAGHGREVSIVVALALLLNILLNSLLLPELGMIGAACATAASIVVWKGWVTYRAASLTGLHTALWYVPRKASHRSPGTQNEISDRAMPIQQRSDL